MRTTLDIDDELFEALLARHPGRSKEEAVEQAIRAYLADEVVARLGSLGDAFPIEDVSAELRRVDRRA